MRFLCALFMVLIVSSAWGQTEPITPDNADQLTELSIIQDISSAEVHFSPDERYGLIKHFWGFSLWNIATNSTQYSVNTDRQILEAVFNHDGTQIITVHQTGAPTVWDVQTGEGQSTFTDDSELWYTTTTHISDRILIATTTPHGIITIWDSQTQSVAQQFRTSQREISGLAFSPDGRYLVSKDSQKQVLRVWDVETGTEVNTLNIEDKTGHDIQFISRESPQQILLVLQDNAYSQVTIWDFETSDILPTPSLIRQPILHPDGKRLVYIDPSQNAIALWDFEQQNSASITTYPTINAINNIYLSPDGGLLFVVINFLDGSNHTQIEIWDITTTQHLRTLTPDYNISALNFNPAGNHLLMITLDAIYIWGIPD